MAVGNVRKTLHRSLFEKPRVYENKSYNAAIDKIFPLKGMFENFLKADRDEERIDVSKHLVLALMQSRRFAPPLRLLMNILHYETKEFSTATVSDTGYIGQDHFVHLVNVYLMGIYIYAYHPQIHRQCKLYLHKLKTDAAAELYDRNPNAAALIKTVNDYEFFAEVWSYFVLYHDLGYPLECIDPDKRGLEGYVDFLKPLRNLKKSFLKDLSLKAIANLITMDILINDEDSLTLEEYRSPHSAFFKLFDAAESDVNAPLKPLQITAPLPPTELDGILKDWKISLHLHKLKGASALHLLTSFLPVDNICAVLENSNTGEIAVVLLGHGDTFSIITPQTPSLLPKRFASFSPKNLADQAFIKAECPIKGFSWEYFIRNGKSTFDSIIGELFPGNTENYFELRSFINKKMPFASGILVGMQSPDHIAAFVFEETSRLMGYLDEPESGDELSSSFDQGFRSFVQVADNFSDHLSSCLRDAAQAAINTKKLKPFDLLTENKYEDMVKEVSKIISALAGESSQIFDKEIGRKIKDDMRYHQCVKGCQKTLRDWIDKQLGSFREGDFNPFMQLPFEKKMTINSSIFRSTTDELEKLNTLLTNFGLNSLEDLLIGYETPLARSSSVDPEIESFVDHGLAAAIIGIASTAFYKRCYQKIIKYSGPKVPTGIKALRLGFVIGSPEEDNALMSALNYLLPASTAAVAMHNLYPKNLKGLEGYKTSLTSNPFAYLCLLSDSLQIWDRRKILNQALSDLSLGFSSNDVNITIEGNQILISARGEKINVSEFDRKYREGLSGFLKGVNHLIRLQVIEA